MRIRRLAAFVAFASLGASLAACSGADEGDVADHHEDDGEATIASTSAALVASDPVSAAVTQACSTTAVKGLSTQLVDEIQCLRPGTMKNIDGVPGLALGAAVFPYLQTPAANALVAAQKARGVRMSINSGLRTLPQQYLLYRWYQTGRCGIGLAARPGTSNHESAVAVDINDNASWRTAMQGNSYRWLGANDPVHFDFTGGGTVDMRGLSVRAFQRLWNRNNPNDTIAEDGSYGPATEARLAKAPVGGFAKGATCSSMSTDAGADASPMPDMRSNDPAEPAAVPDATEPARDDASEGLDPELGEPAPPFDGASEGCASSPLPPPAGRSGLVLALGAAAMLLRRRTRTATR